MENNSKTNSTKKRFFSLMLVLLFFCFLVCLGIVWKSFFWFDKKFDEDITSYCNQHGVEESLVYAVIKAESNFDESAVSKKGAVGLMQLMPSTAEFTAGKLGWKTFNIEDTKQNLLIGIFYLSYLQKRFSEDTTAVAAYNAGETVVARWLQDERYSSDGKTLKNIPYGETNNYVKKVKNFRAIYIRLY